MKTFEDIKHQHWEFHCSSMTRGQSVNRPSQIFLHVCPIMLRFCSCNVLMLPTKRAPRIKNAPNINRPSQIFLHVCPIDPHFLCVSRRRRLAVLDVFTCYPIFRMYKNPNSISTLYRLHISSYMRLYAKNKARLKPWDWRLLKSCWLCNALMLEIRMTCHYWRHFWCIDRQKQQSILFQVSKSAVMAITLWKGVSDGDIDSLVSDVFVLDTSWQSEGVHPFVGVKAIYFHL